MKLFSLASAAWAATELARLPVEAQATTVKPNSIALVTATATTRSLNERVGWQTASFLMYTSLAPKASARFLARIRGVMPQWLPTGRSSSTGSRSRYRHMLGGGGPVRLPLRGLCQGGREFTAFHGRND